MGTLKLGNWDVWLIRLDTISLAEHRYFHIAN